MVKGWFYKEYGSVDVLQFGEISLPSLGPGQVLIKVRAAALNPVDFKIRQNGFSGTLNITFPVHTKPKTGSFRVSILVFVLVIKHKITFLLFCLGSVSQAVPGADVAGVVADVGDGVSKFKKGDEVYGDILQAVEGHLRQVGTLAEYTVAEEHLLAFKPSNLSFEEAASLPLALLTALLAFDSVEFQKGQSVFIVGGAGGVGSLAIQLAKNVFEASRIVSTCSTGKVEFVKSLGADLVVDYTKQSYEQVDEKFDFVFDTIGESFKSHVVAKEEGKIVDIASFPPHPRAENVRLSQPQGRNLERLREYIESGKVKAVIDPKSPFAFSDVVEAFKHLESGRARGKIVISPI